MKQSIQLSDHFGYGRLLRFTIPSILMMIFSAPDCHVPGSGGRDAGELRPVWPDHSGGAPFLMLQYAFSSLSVTAEKPKLGLIVTIVSGILNMTGDALFMGVFRWGIAGAAMASAMGQIVGGIVPLIYFFRKNSSSLQIRKPKWDGRALLRASTNGVSELMSNISMSIVGMLSSQQTAQHFHLFRGGGPACGKSDDGVEIIVCFPEAKFHLPCQLFHDGIFHHAENLVGRRAEAKLVTILDECCRIWSAAWMADFPRSHTDDP